MRFLILAGSGWSVLCKMNAVFYSDPMLYRVYHKDDDNDIN